MAKKNLKIWERAWRARNALEKELEGNEEVCYVDIGHPHGEAGSDEPSLRIHTSGEGDRSAYPQKFDDMSVVISSDCDDT